MIGGSRPGSWDSERGREGPSVFRGHRAGSGFSERGRGGLGGPERDRGIPSGIGGFRAGSGGPELVRGFRAGSGDSERVREVPGEFGGSRAGSVTMGGSGSPEGGPVEGSGGTRRGFRGGSGGSGCSPGLGRAERGQALLSYPGQERVPPPTPPCSAVPRNRGRAPPPSLRAAPCASPPAIPIFELGSSSDPQSLSPPL